MSRAPRRIVCLSAETADWLWRIGASESIVGTTAYFSQPGNMPSKPCVSGFSSANLAQIEKLNPDLVITFSDVQAKLAAELMQRGLFVLATNQRTLTEIEATLALLSRIVDRERAGEKLLKEFRKRLAPDQRAYRQPRVYFEEWNDPLISGICWVSELIERAGGKDIFPKLRMRRAARERVVSPEQVRHAKPEIIFASWCGKPVQFPAITARHGWHKVPAVINNQLYEIPGDDILQPGFRLIRGYEFMKKTIRYSR